MIVTITADGQITIPLPLRQRFHLNVGDQLEFDETAPVLTARRVVNRGEWEKTMSDWQKSAAKSLKGHPWQDQPSAVILDELRGGPAEFPSKASSKKKGK
jgi:AbrB family looped-hinge helix DNA binding protein